jgi:hypothetical protein
MTKEQAHAAIAEAERAGFDLSLVDYNLSLKPEERCLQHAAALEFASATSRGCARTPSNFRCSAGPIR